MIHKRIRWKYLGGHAHQRREDHAARKRRGEQRRHWRESSAGRPNTARKTTGLAAEWVEEGERRPGLRGIKGKLTIGGESKVAGVGEEWRWLL